MEPVTLILAIAFVLILAGLDSMVYFTHSDSHGHGEHDQPTFASNAVMDSLPMNQRFVIEFPDGHKATAVRTTPDGDATELLKILNLEKRRPALFITGGASNMSDMDMERTKRIMEDGIARFAAEYGALVVDGGTESGVMQMIGDARRRHKYQFPLIGVAPYGKIEYPGIQNPNKEAELEDSHSHFVLVEGNDWGDESPMLIKLSRTIADNTYPAIGILINGGRISRQDVLLATTQGKHSVPILVLEGSGRFADELATAFRTGKTNQAILKAIIDGGDIELIATIEGADAVYKKLVSRFKKY